MSKELSEQDAMWELLEETFPGSKEHRLEIDLPNEVDYIACGFTPGDLAAMGEFGGSRKFGWAPAESQFSITVQPIYSRDKQTKFSYKNFINGSNLGAGYI